MDGGPFRAQRPSGRTTTHRQTSAQTHRPEETQPPIVDEPQAPTRTPSYIRRQEVPEDKSWFKRLVWPIIITIALVVGLVGGYLIPRSANSGTAGLPIEEDKYQAVFLTNGQVYFGKLKSVNSEYLKLADVYYLQSGSTTESGAGNPQDKASNSDDTKLIKLGDEIHGPQDAMIIAKDQMLFFENLKTDGTVVKSIAKSKE